MATQAGLATCSLALVLLALHGSPPVAALFGVAFVAAGLGAVDQPTRSSAIPRLVPPQRLPAAIALNQLNFQMASIVGPAFGGILIATVGLAGAYTVDLLSFLASLVALLSIHPLPPLGVVARPGRGITVGDRTGIGDHCFFWGQGGIEIGSDVIFGPDVQIFSENHRFDDPTIPISRQGEDRRPVVIGNDCWIGGRVTILAGVHIGGGCVIGAGSLVTKDIPPNSVAVGAPARVVRQRTANAV